MPTRFFIFVAIVQAILWLGHGLLYATAITFFPLDHTTAALILAFLSITFVTATLLAWRYHSLLTRIYYFFAAVWLGVAHVVLMASLLAWVALGFVHLVPIAAGTADQFSIADATLAVGTVVFTAAMVVSAYGLTLGRRVRTTHYAIRLPNLPSVWRGRTAVWISDLHLGHIYRPGFSRRITRRVNRLKPDIIFIGGDLFDGADGDLDNLLKPLTELSAPLGVYFITGNHEEFTNREHFLKPIRETGNIRILLNEAVDIDGLRVIGVDYRDTTNPQRYAQILAQLASIDSQPSVLLKHDPANPRIAAELGVSLQISGHTHRGQLFPFNLMTRRIYGGHDYGLTRLDGTQIITSSGTGSWGPPMRLGTRSEIVQIAFE